MYIYTYICIYIYIHNYNVHCKCQFDPHAVDGTDTDESQYRQFCGSYILEIHTFVSVSKNDDGHYTLIQVIVRNNYLVRPSHKVIHFFDLTICQVALHCSAINKLDQKNV
jgi:hypothetical protein